MTAPLDLCLRRTVASAPNDPVPVSIELTMPSDVSEVEAVVELVARHCFAGVAPCPRTVFRFRVTLAEALANAILRGNGEDRSKRVWVRAEVRTDSIRLSVRDEGNGFDPTEVAALPFPQGESDRGRGLTIIRNLADRVEFNDRGNTIWMTLPRC